MIVQTLNKNEFRNEFNSIRKDNFSYEGLNALYDWLDEYYEEADKGYKLDVIGICCEFTEYDSLRQFNKDYNRGYDSIDDIVDDTLLIKIDNNKFIIQNF